MHVACSVCLLRNVMGTFIECPSAKHCMSDSDGQEASQAELQQTPTSTYSNTNAHMNRTTEAWLRYVKRRKEEFWDSWDKTYGQTAIRAWGSALLFRIYNSPVGMAAQRRWRRLRARYFPGVKDAETDDTGMDELELAERAHGRRLKLLLVEEEEAAMLLSLAANKVPLIVVLQGRRGQEGFRRGRRGQEGV